MASMSEDYGYDEDFLEPPREYLKCNACHFVLKNPVQIMSCGHRYCELCFERIKQYSEHLKLVLCCPVDRQEIDISQVFKDTGMARIVDDLHVKCPFHVHECIWSGELRNLEDHKKQCNYARKEATVCAAGSSENKLDALLVNDICERLGKCEERIIEKEKDLAHVKYNLQEMKDKVNKRDKEIDTLKLTNGEMTREINSLKETNKTLEETIHMGLLKCENNYLINKSEIDQLKVMQGETQHQRVEEIQNLRTEIEEINKKITESKSKVCQSQESIKTIEKGLKNAQDEYILYHDIRTKQNNIDESLSDVKVQVRGLLSNAVKDKVNEESFEEMFKGINELRAYINHTNGLLSFKNLSFKDTCFIWTITNFKEQFEAKKDIESSKFYCRPKGHLCQLFGIFFPGEEDMKPCFRLAKGKNSADVAEFEMNISCKILYNDGTELSDTITPALVNENRESCFTLSDNSDVTVGMGFRRAPFKKDDMDKYLIDDTCTVVCTLTPPN